MKLHVRPYGRNKFTFRLSILGRYVDASDSWDTEDDAAFFADVAKYYLREVFCIPFEQTLDGDMFAMFAYRRSIDMTDRAKILDAVAVNVRTFIEVNRPQLEKYAEQRREARKPWEVLRDHPSPEISKWAYDCACAEQIQNEYATVKSSAFFMRLNVVENSLDTAINSLGVAVKQHGHTPPPALQLRVESVKLLRTTLQQTLAEVRELYDRLHREQCEAEVTLSRLEANRPSLV